MTNMIFDIQRASTVDGPGFRTTVFFKGCNLRCAWCHNPESQEFGKQLLFYSDRCKGCGICKEICPNKLQSCDLCGRCAYYCSSEARVMCGEVKSASEIMNVIIADRDFYANDGGVTFSGGECMLQPKLLLELLRDCKAQRVHTAVDTAGCVPFSVFESIIEYTDLFLFDIKMMDPVKHRRYTGVSNDLILANLARLLDLKTRIWVRVPVVTGVNDNEEEMRAIRSFLEKHGVPEKVELLPYHRMGIKKAHALGNEPVEFEIPTPNHIAQLERVFHRMEE